MQAALSHAAATALLLLVLMNGAHAAEPLRPLHTDTPPIIDGVLSEPIWKEAPSVTGFKTWMPDYGSPMLGQTEVSLAYDSENLYFAFRCHDPEPDKIKSSVTARDKIQPDDWICLHLDTFNLQQSMYAFYVNPAGIQMDARAAAGDEEDVSIDVVWHSGGRIDAEGYVVELGIPLKSLRFSMVEPLEMGILLERSISRTSQLGTYPELDPRQGPNFFTQTRTVSYPGVAHDSLIEVLPAVTWGRSSSREQESLVSRGNRTDTGVTVKFGMTTDLVFDATYNPDFSQVEADAGQVDFNLRYALFYDEKRPFFLEGMEHFDFGGASMGDALRSVVHTRTIVDPLVGAKLTGQAWERNTFAAIYALDELPEDFPDGDRADVGILRYKRTLERDGFLGGFATIRETDTSFNRVGGADGQIRLTDSSHLGFHGFMSRSHRNHEAPTETGHALGAKYYYRTRNWTADVRLFDLSEDFDTQVGYLTRNGITKIHVAGSRLLYPRSSVILRADPMVITSFTYDEEGDRWEHYGAAFLGFTLPRSTRIRGGPAARSEVFRGREFDTSFLRLAVNSQCTKEFFVYVDYQYGRKIRYVADPYQGRGHLALASLVYQPVEKFQSGLDCSYTDFVRDSDGRREFEYTIVRLMNTFQVNSYIFFRGILEHNWFRDELTAEFLASFTYVPGTVFHVGYGSLHDRLRWHDGQYVESDRYRESRREFFLKASYLWRM